jgi:tRNA 2-thiouridine synthesizing protein A
VTDPASSAAVPPTGAGPIPQVAREIDATGLSCPMPVIELAQAIDLVGIGERVGLTATDPAARVDVPVWCRMQRHVLRGMEGTDDSWRFVVERTR